MLRYQDLRSELDTVVAELQEALETEVRDFTDRVEEKQVPAVLVPAL